MTAASLEERLAKVEARLVRAEHEREEYRKLYELASLELDRLRRHLFGRKAEAVSAAQTQLAFEQVASGLFPKPLADALLEAPRQQPQAPAPEKKRTPHGRRPLPEHLPVERVEILPAEVKVEGEEAFERIGEEVSETLEWRAASLVRVQLVRPKFVRKGAPASACEAAPRVQVAEVPERPIARGLAGPGLLAHVVVSKYADHLPLHRQERIFARQGLSLSRSTLCGWMEPLAALAGHVVNAMWEDAMRAHCLAVDATGVLVQAHEKCRRGHFWVVLADMQHVLFRYTPGHTKQATRELLGDYRGYVLADAATVYDHLFLDGERVEVGCWAHARRGFFYALKTDAARALVAIGLIQRLYEADRQNSGLTGTERTEARAAHARPVLTDLFAWAERESLTALPKSPLGEALTYLLNQRMPLERFLEDGRLRLDNNASENALRHQAVGRKNWLFVGSDEGAEWNATFVSLIASCRLHDLEPWAYLRDLFCLLPDWPRSRVLELSPKCWNETLKQEDTQRRLAENVFRRVTLASPS